MSTTTTLEGTTPVTSDSRVARVVDRRIPLSRLVRVELRKTLSDGDRARSG